ncbi:MAG: STAS domain-containing protein [Pseudomonadales bacterium]|nr:STAS domain-containing protein [Pseudomonadales bacterium]
MSEGRILVGDHDGVYVLKFVGDVRVNLCATVDAFVRDVFRSDDLASLLVDLTETEGIDSTSLGLLARLSNETRRRIGAVPTLISTNPDVTRVLHTTGFDDVFHLLEEPLDERRPLGELAPVSSDADALRERVIDAHRALMDLNERNRESFRDLVSALEADGEE